MKFKDGLYVALQFGIIVLFFTIPGDALLKHSVFKVSGTLLSVIGLAILCGSLLNLGRNLTPFPTPLQHSVLVTTGIYQYIRHPIYTAILFLFGGLAMILGSGTRLLLVAVLFVLFDFKAAYEERLLEARYPDYKKYKSVTPKFFPSINQFVK